MIKCRKIFSLALFFSLIFSSFLAFATTTQSEVRAQNEGFRYVVAPYIWASSVQADFTVGDLTRSVHIPFNKILQQLDFAAMGYLEAGYGPVSIALNPIYLRISKNFTADSITTNVISRSTLIDGGVYVRLASQTTSTGQYLSLELLGGGRYLAENIEFQTPMRNLSGTARMVAPIIGGRIKYDPSQKVHLWFQGDGGGFHVDNVTSTWSTLLALGYTVHKHIDLAFAYRVLKIDYSGNAGTSANTLLYGPLLGISFHQ